MPKFRKKPVVIDAALIADLLHLAEYDWQGLPEWVRDSYNAENGITVFVPEGLYIKTLEGEMFGAKDNYLIRGVQGELYACKPDIFAATYEPIEEAR